MRKMMFFCRRRADIDHDQYAEMVLADHVPLALTHHPTMRKYVVNLVDHVPAGEPAYDSVAELSFDTQEDYERRLYDSDDGRRVVMEDVARFMGGADAYATTEHVHRQPTPAGPIGGRSPRVKLLCPIRRNPDLSHEAFVEHWINRHRPLALAHHPGLIGYVANVVDQVLSDGSPSLDGIGELYFDSPRSLRDEMFGSPEDERIIRDDVERFIGHTNAYLVTEYVQKRP